MAKRIVLTEHAQGEARRRGIREAVVLDVATAPEQRKPVRGNREARQSRIVEQTTGKLQLIRVIVDLGDPEIVVTVYRTSKIAKYWSRQ